MTNRHRSKQGSLEGRLRGATAPEPAAWERMRRALAERAVAEGLVDVAFECHASPLGAIVLGATREGLVRVGLPAEGAEDVLEELARLVSPRVLCAARDPVTQARRQLDEYFAGRRRSFDVPLDWRLARGFRREVLRAAARIPYGRTSTYREIAGEAGSPRAFRAAGSALAHNPLPILVPCHRVLPASGGLGDYRGGSAAKAQLLRLEEAL